MRRASSLVLALCALQPAAAAVNEQAILERRPPKLLSQYGFFSDLRSMSPAQKVLPYEIAAPLFTDYADKSRYIFSPQPVLAPSAGLPEFPVGSALIKTFHYGEHKVETRVLLRQNAGWKSWPYVWNAEGSEAKLKIAGANLSIATEHGQINYRVPNANQCKGCHVDASGMLQPIGPKMRNLNIGDQLLQLTQSGLFVDVPSHVATITDYRDQSAKLEDRARSYLDANCAHCHSPGLPADTSGLYLNWEETRAIHLGIAKHPVAAGRGSGGRLVDIDPGKPDSSIMVFRMESTDPDVKMPELGRSVVHKEGVALIREYISSME